jgi:hypothetical protein
LAVGVKGKGNIEAVLAGGKKEKGKVEITSLNSHFPHQEPQHKLLRRKKRSQ